MAITKEQVADTIADIAAGLRNWRIWVFLGWTDIRLRYRRTIIGPFWMTLSTGVMITAMGFVWGILFKAELSEFFPYLASGLVTWFLISTMVTESTNAIAERPDNLKNFNLPISYTAFRLVVRNLIVFLHNIVIYFVVAIAFGTDFLTAALPLALIGLVLVLVNGAWIAVSLGILGARFRDIQQLIAVIMTVLFLVTPIFWQRRLLGDHQFIALFNPITHFIDVVREPLLGLPPHPLSLAVMVSVAILGWAGTLLLLARCRHRIVFWL